MKRRTIIIFLAVVAVTTIMLVTIPNRVFAFETDLPLQLVPQFLIQDLSLQIDNFNLTFPYGDTTLQIHIGSADIECRSELMDENATRTQIDLQCRDFAMHGPISLKYESLELHLTIMIYHADSDTHLYAEGFAIMPVYQYLWAFLSNLI